MNKALLVIFNPALEEKVMDALTSAGMVKYTSFPYLRGVGKNSEPHLDTHIWPGSNMALFIAGEDALLKTLVETLRPIKQESLREGLKVFMLPVEEVL